MSAASADWPRVLVQVVFPPDGDHDVLPLYVDAAVAGPTQPEDDTAPVVAWERANAAGQPVGRRGYEVPASARTSFATYHNAFPAGYWQRWTTLRSVTLRLRTHGAGSIFVYRSTAAGAVERVATRAVAGSTLTLVDLPLDRFVDGGWYWFDLVAGDQPLNLEAADWLAGNGGAAEGSPPPVSTATVGITTYNRPAYCLALLRQLAEATGPAGDLADLVDRVVVVDQGTDRIEDQEGFADVAAALGERLSLLTQPNLGGSGGFARSMLETLSASRSGHVLLLDDDVVLEPEAIRRVLAFSDHARRPTVVGGHMFSMYGRSVLHAYAETVLGWRFWWRPSPGTRHDHDLAQHNLRATPWLHRRADAAYTGWWMCLIPVAALRVLGLSLPFFIKWDDAEYGLRARAAGIPTVSLPGAAVWHVPWTDKDDAVDWQAYYHCRNRVVAALLHSPFPSGGRLVADSFAVQVKHILAQQYSAAELRLRAIEDVLSGPQHLHAQLGTRLGELAEVRRRFQDATTKPDPENFPPVRDPRPRRRDTPARRPRHLASALLSLGTATLHQLQPVSKAARDNPQRALAAADAGWWSLGRIDSALVSSTDGSGVAQYQRDQATAASLLRRSIAVHARLRREWGPQSVTYRGALPFLVSPTTWRRTLSLPAEQTEGGTGDEGLPADAVGARR